MNTEGLNKQEQDPKKAEAMARASHTERSMAADHREVGAIVRNRDGNEEKAARYESESEYYDEMGDKKEEIAGIISDLEKEGKHLSIQAIEEIKAIIKKKLEEA